MFLVTVFLKIRIIVTLCLLYVSLQLFTRLVLDVEVGREAWEERLGVLVRNLRTMRAVYWVSVSESSGFAMTLLVRSSDP